ncbi:MAG: hypothetical protein ACP5F1_05850 [Thermoplasmata archaeon]|nr:hypothetical protein [Thermoplasmata archaeon]
MNEPLDEKESEPVIIPGFIYKIWKTRIKEHFEMEVENDILEVLIKTYYVRSTWKWQRAYKSIVELMLRKGYSKKESDNYAKSIIRMFDANNLRSQGED